jgi:Short C-terminal domain
MPKLSPEGLRAVADIARRTGFSPDAVTAMLFAVIAGNGSMAQFSHPEFGGSGQWMSGGAIMLSDMFNNALKARVDALCGELAALVKRDPAVTVVGAFQAQSQGGVSPFLAGQSGLLAPEPSGGASWWPAELGAPASVGAQNAMRYAYFPAARRLAVDHNGKVTVYDTQDHRITGFSQQQPGSGSVAVVSQHGAVDLGRLPVVEEDGAAPSSPAVAGSGSENAPSGAAAILAVIEQLADLRAKGVLTEAEFSAKKAELLSRL